MRRNVLLTLALALTAAGCSPRSPVAPRADSTNSPTNVQVDTSELDRLEQSFAQPDEGLPEVTSGHRLVTVPAGSHDALAAAIASAGAGGVVVLESGTHTESATVVIDRTVTLVGESGAELASSAGAPDPFLLRPALWVRAHRVTIRGLSIHPLAGNGSCAIVIHNANDALVFRNRITGFQSSVVLARGDRTRIWSNTIVGVGLGDGADLVNGSETSLLRNDISGGSFGVFPCGARGVLAFNNLHDNGWGAVFCKVPEGSFQLPDGTVLGADISATRWLVTGNTTVNNAFNGLLVIDGSNHNLLVDNASSGNGTYDVELAGDSYRFGFLTPASHDNTFIAGRYRTIEIKNCGNNNTVLGGTLVDNTAEPCD